VTAPEHYLAGGIETIDIIRAKLTPEGFIGYLEGNILKYQCRWRYKGGIADLRKAQEYQGWLIAAQQSATLATLTAESQRMGLYDTAGEAPELSPEVEARIYADSDDNVGGLKAGEAG